MLRKSHWNILFLNCTRLRGLREEFGMNGKGIADRLGFNDYDDIGKSKLYLVNIYGMKGRLYIEWKCVVSSELN